MTNTRFSRKEIITYIALAIMSICLMFSILASKPHIANGSVAFGNEYLSTSTAQSNVYGAQIAADIMIRNGTGTLGSVVIEGANTGPMNFFDATTTNINARTGNKATSTILIASIPASTVAGTYTFDIQLQNGLVYDVPSGIVPTTTITYR